RFGEIDAANLELSLRTNAIGPLLLTQALVPLLGKGVAPRVVNISSILGSIGSTDAFGTPSYAMGKAALNMATRQCALALRDQGIGVFALHPGWVATDMGTARAPLAPADSVAGLIRVIDASTLADSGTLRDWQGKPLPW
ncbi:MAG: SDR family NAD(P)-dependent oxidoreductase, partial [Lysobacterales bacterium]